VPYTSRTLRVFLQKAKVSHSACDISGGDDRARTGDPRLAKPMLSQLSYVPGCGAGGLGTPGHLIGDRRRRQFGANQPEVCLRISRTAHFALGQACPTSDNGGPSWI
jgi:hypothetical protein